MDTVRDLSPVLYLLFHVCLICFKRPSPTRLKWIVVATINFLVVCTLIGVVYKISDIIFYTETGTLQFLDVVQVCGPILVHLVILGETLLHPSNEVELWNSIATVEHELQTFCTGQDNCALSQAISKDFVLLCLVALAPEIFIIAGTYKTAPNISLGWLMRLWSLQMGRFCLLHMKIYLNFISDKFNKMQMELEHIVQSQCPPSKAHQRAFYQRINDIRRTHAALWKMHFNIRGRFKYSVIAMLMNIFMCLTIGVYWVCAVILKNIESYRIEFIMVIFPFLIMLMSHGVTSEGLKRKAKYLAATLHKTPTSELSKENLNLLRRFSVQMLYTKAIYGGLNIFYVDFENLQTIVFVLSKYLVILFSINAL